MRLRYPQNKDRGGGLFGYLEVALFGKGVANHLKVCLGKQGEEETIQINYKMNFVQDSCQRFSLYFKSTFHWMLHVYCITQKMHISQELGFLWTTLQYHEALPFCNFSSKTLYALDKTSPSKCTFLDLQLLAWKLIKFLVLCNLSNELSILHHLSVSWQILCNFLAQILYTSLKRSPIKYKHWDFRMLDRNSPCHLTKHNQFLLKFCVILQCCDT